MRISSLFPLCLLAVLAWLPDRSHAQAVPNPAEGIPYLVTFGAAGDPAWGDDDHCQTFFFLVPKNTGGAVYLRIFDPDTGGQLDEKKGDWNTQVSFSVYGGDGAHSTPDAQATDPKGNYLQGNLLTHKVFGKDPAADGQWVTFGPFDPHQGELVPEFGGYVFKVVATGTSGDDGNLYSYFLSTSATENLPVEGGNGFTYEYTFRLPSVPGSQVHLYPFVARNVISIKQSNFDGDADGELRLYSVARNGHPATLSGDNQWATSLHLVDKREKGLSMDIAYSKRSASPNDIVFYVTDQYDKALPFFAIPLGGKPKYKYTVDIRFK